MIKAEQDPTESFDKASIPIQKYRVLKNEYGEQRNLFHEEFKVLNENESESEPIDVTKLKNFAKTGVF